MNSGNEAAQPQPQPAEEDVIKTTDDLDFDLDLDRSYHVENPENRAEPLGKPIFSLIDSEMQELILGFLQMDRDDLRGESSLCDTILERTPADAKAIEDKAYISSMLPRFDAAIDAGSKAFAHSKDEWEDKTSSSERARQRMWQQAYNLFCEQGFQNDEAAAEADKSLGPMPGPTKPWAIDSYDSGRHSKTQPKFAPWPP